MTPHPRTLANIDLQGERERTSRDYTVAPCGCYVPDDATDRHGWTLCQYHEGFDDACEDTPEPVDNP